MERNLSMIMAIVATVAITATVLFFVNNTTNAFTGANSLTVTDSKIISIGSTGKLSASLINAGANSITVTGLEFANSTNSGIILNPALVLNSTVAGHGQFGLGGIVERPNGADISLKSGDTVILTVKYKTQSGEQFTSDLKIRVG